MRLYNIIKKPIVTEKATMVELKNNTYIVEVSEDATKIDVKKAIFEIYGIEVQAVTILNTREKFKQGKKGQVMKRRPYRKAYITLKDEKSKIDFSILK